MNHENQTIVQKILLRKIMNVLSTKYLARVSKSGMCLTRNWGLQRVSATK